VVSAPSAGTQVPENSLSAAERGERVRRLGRSGDVFGSAARPPSGSGAWG
jgi:hypothetical protein